MAPYMKLIEHYICPGSCKKNFKGKKDHFYRHRDGPRKKCDVEPDAKPTIVDAPNPNYKPRPEKAKAIDIHDKDESSESVTEEHSALPEAGKEVDAGDPIRGSPPGVNSIADESPPNGIPFEAADPASIPIGEPEEEVAIQEEVEIQEEAEILETVGEYEPEEVAMEAVVDEAAEVGERIAEQPHNEPHSPTAILPAPPKAKKKAVPKRKIDKIVRKITKQEQRSFRQR